MIGSTKPVAMIAANTAQNISVLAKHPVYRFENVTLYQNPAPTTQALMDAINGAQSVVDVALFALHPSGSGQQLVEIMKAKARQGVEVNLVLDTVGSFQYPFSKGRKMVKELRDAGVNVKLTEPFSPNKKARFVDHRKMIIVDGKRAFIGGMNFSKMFDNWHDVMTGYSGPAAAVTARLFIERWNALGARVTERHARTALLPTDNGLGDAATGVAIVGNTPDTKTFHVTDAIMNQIRSAKNRVWIMSPFVSDGDIARELAAAARRGVDVRVVTSQKSTLTALPFLPKVTRAFLDDVIEAGGKHYEVDGVLHAKAVIADDEASIGSYNLSKRAGYHDHEMNIFSADPGFKRQVEQLFIDDIARSKEIRLSDIKGPFQGFLQFVQEKFNVSY